MKLVYRHILSDLVPAFVLFLVLFAGFIWIAGGPLLNAVGDLGRVSLWTVLQLMVLYLPQMLVLALPMAVLIAVILAFNRLSSESEAVAMFASGISFYQMLKPTVWFALAVTVIGLVTGNSIEPAANTRITYIKSDIGHDVSQTIEPFPLPPVRYSNKNLQALVWVDGGFDTARQELRRVTIIEFDPKSGLPAATIWAESAQWLGGSSWRLENGSWISRDGITSQFPTMQTQDIRQAPDTIALLQDDSETGSLSFLQLSRRIAALKRQGATTSKILRLDEVDLWEKIALPCACLVFALVGAPLALKPQRAATRGAAAVYGVGIILGYYALYKFLEIAGQSGSLDPELAAFLPNLIGIALAAYLISKVTT